jgi:hypothetical protein
MYIWNTKSLAQKLKDGSLTQSGRVKYLLATVVLYVIVLEGSFLIGESLTFAFILRAVLLIAITIVGTLYSYRVNRDGDNREFLDRYICIGWVVSIKTTVLASAVYFSYLLVGFAIGGEAFGLFVDSTSFVDVGFASIVCALCYWRLAENIRRVAN